MHGRNEVGQEDWLPGLGKWTSHRMWQRTPPRTEKVRRDRMTRQAKMAKGHPKGLGRGNLKEEVNSQGLQGATSFKDMSDTTTGGDASRPHLFICVSPGNCLPHCSAFLPRPSSVAGSSKIHTCEKGATDGALFCFLTGKQNLYHARELLLASLVAQVDVEAHADIADQQLPSGRYLKPGISHTHQPIVDKGL